MATAAGGLSPQQVQQFREDGFLAIPAFASPDELSALKARVAELLASFNPDAQKGSIFSTRNQARMGAPHARTHARAVAAQQLIARQGMHTHRRAALPLPRCAAPTQATHTDSTFLDSAADVSFFLEARGCVHGSTARARLCACAPAQQRTQRPDCARCHARRRRRLTRPAGCGRARS